MVDNVMSIRQSNLAWLSDSAPSLLELFHSRPIAEIIIHQNISDYDLYFGQERVLESCNKTLKAHLHQQLVQTDGVAMPRPISSEKLSNNSGLILSEMVNKHSEVLLDYMPSIHYINQKKYDTKPPYKNLVVFGSLMLLPLLKYLLDNDKSPWLTITLVEDDWRQFLSSISFFSLEEFVEVCKLKGVGFSLHVDDSKQNLQDRLYSQISLINPTLLYGWQTLRSPVRSPCLMELHSWLHAPEGAAQSVLGILGFATDEINQTQQALWNALSQKNMKILTPNSLTGDVPVVLVASGPSLSESLPWLFEQQKSLNIVASGSSLGSLLRAGIRPNAAVFLERGAEVYSDICDLVTDGFELNGIHLIASSTIDPRVPQLFGNVVFFHRPVSAATNLFGTDQSAILPVCGPHVINAALEAILCLGSRKITLIGADFGARKRSVSRADGALGESPRSLSIPVRGTKGRTIFSDPELLQTAYLLNRVISATPLLSVMRLGEGAVLEGASVIEISDTFTQKMSSSPGALQQALLNSQTTSFCGEDINLFFSKIKDDLETVVSDLQIVSDCWDKSYVNIIAPFLQRQNQDGSRPRQFLIRLLCQPLFFAAMPLHDCDESDLQEFAICRENFSKSIQLINQLVLDWLDVMHPWLTAPQLPIWDPEWLRTRYLKIKD